MIDEALRRLVEEAVRPLVEKVEKIERLLQAETTRQARGADSPFLTTEEAAKIAHVVAVTIREWAATGKLPARRAGRRILILPADLEALLQSRALASVERSPDPSVVADGILLGAPKGGR